MTGSGGEVSRGNVSGTMETWEALKEINKVMGNILKRVLQNRRYDIV